MTTYQFWSDDFDMDLLKVLPETTQILGSLAERILYTVGGTTHGRLNHPAVFHDRRGMIAWFGTDSMPGLEYPTFVPSGYSHGSRVVECTALEAFRDAWPHRYAIVLNHTHLIWNTALLMPSFDAIMWHRRGWRVQPERERRALDILTDSLVEAAERLMAALL